MSRLGMALGVVGIVLTIVGFAGPWWTINTSASALGQTFSSAAEFRMFGGTVTSVGPGVNQTQTTDYADSPNTRSVFLGGAALSGVAIAAGVVMVALAGMAGRRPSVRRLGSVAGILAFVLGLVAVLYVMASLPAAANQDSGDGQLEISGFWGTSSTQIFGVSATATWAAGWAWYGVLVGAILFLVAGVLVMMAPKAAPTRPPEAVPGPPESPPGP